MASKNRYSALATDAEAEREDFDREFAEASHVHILGSPKLSPRWKPDANAHENGDHRSPSFSLESDASARSFDSGAFGESPYRARNPPPPRGGFDGGAPRRVSFSDIEDVHEVDDDEDDDEDDDDDDLSVSFARLFSLDQSEANESVSESESGDELSRVAKKCESLHSENLCLAQQLRSMRMLVKSHRKKLDSQTRLKNEVSNLQESLWASITGSQQPRQSIFDGPTPSAVSAVQRGRANTELGPSMPMPTPTTRQRAHTDFDVGRLALPPNSPMPPPKSKKRPSRLSFSAFFGRSPSAEPAEDNDEEDTLIEEEKEVSPSGSTAAMRVRAQSAVTPRPVPRDDGADESRPRSKSFPSASESDSPSRNSGNSYPALQRQVSVLESKLASSRKKRGHYKALEKKFLDMKLEHATKCAELEEMQMQFSVNAREQQSVVSDLNTALVDKVNLKSQVEQLRDRLEEVTKEYQLLQQNHRQLQNHIDVSSRKSSVSLTPGGGAPALPVATSWRASLARRFSSLASSVDDGEELAHKMRRERSKTHHGHHQRRKKRRSSKKHSKHARSKSEVSTGTGTNIKNDRRQTDRKSLPPQPLYLVGKTPKPNEKDKLDVLTGHPHTDDSADDFDFVDGDMPLAQFRGWFGGASSNANVKGDDDADSGGRTGSLEEGLLQATGSSSNSPLSTSKPVHVIL